MGNSNYKNFTIVEIGNDTTKMIVGSYSEPFPFIYCVKETPTRNVMDNGYIKNDCTNKVVNAISEVLNIKDEAISTKSSMQRVFVLLPPSGFRVFRTREVSAVMGRSNNDGKIDKEDIRQLFRNIVTRTKQNYGDYTQIEVLPYLYDYGVRTSESAPIGEVAEQIGVKAFAHVVPHTLERNHDRVFDFAKVRPAGFGVSSFGAFSLISKERKDLTDYLILDLGGSSTVVSVVGQSCLFNSETLNTGMNSLTEAIMERFHIDFEEAERLKRIYGYSQRETLFNAPIIKNGMGESFYQGNLNQVIEQWFNNFNIKLETCIKEALKVHLDNNGQEAERIVSRCPIIVIGGGANLLGIENLLKKSAGNHKIEKFVPSVAGLRDPKYVSIVGYLVAKCTNQLQFGPEDEQRVLTRNPD